MSRRFVYYKTFTVRDRIDGMKRMHEIIGERIKTLREARGISQQQLAKLCGWSAPSRLSNYEKGSRKVSSDDAITLGKALGVSPAHILFGDGSDEQSYPEPSPKEKVLLDLFNSLPEKDREELITGLKEKERRYNELYQELKEIEKNKIRRIS